MKNLKESIEYSFWEDLEELSSLNCSFEIFKKTAAEIWERYQMVLEQTFNISYKDSNDIMKEWMNLKGIIIERFLSPQEALNRL